MAKAGNENAPILVKNQVQPELDGWTEKEIGATWFHVVRDLIKEGTIAKIGATAWAVYCVIKAHSDMKTGAAWPGVKHIAELMGVSEDTVNRALKVLVEHKLVTIEKRGRQNRYMITEKFPIYEKRENGKEVVGWADANYSPIDFKNNISDLKTYAEKGILPPGSNIDVHITVQVQNIKQGDNGVAVMNANASATASDENGNTFNLKEEAIRDLMRFTNYRNADVVEVDSVEKNAQSEKEKEEKLKKIRDLT